MAKSAKSTAKVAVAMAIAVHILPEAIDGGGWPVLVVAATGLIAPMVFSRATAKLGARHRRIAAELGYVAVLFHQLSDGLALGAATDEVRHWDLLIGVGAALPHIVDGLPDFFRTLVVALGFGEAALGTLIIIKHPNP